MTELKVIAEDLHSNLVRTWENPEQFRGYIEGALEKVEAQAKAEERSELRGKIENLLKGGMEAKTIVHILMKELSHLEANK